MRSHEAYEERKLYPFLSERWSVDFGPARAGHTLLHARYDAVVARFRETSSDESKRLALIEALAAHDEVLREHLDLEEELVIPLLLGLTPDEFDDYSDA